MRGQLLQIQHLRPRLLHLLQQTAFSAAGRPAHNAVCELRRPTGELVDHVAPVRFVAAVKLGCRKTDFLQDMRQRSAACSAAPAIHRRPIGLGFAGEMRLKVMRDVARDQSSPDFLGFE